MKEDKTPINIDEMNIDDYIAEESPILYHVYNNNKN